MFTFSKGFVRNSISTFFLLGISAATLMAAPQLRLSTTAVGPVYVENGAAARPQTVNAFNTGDGSLNLTVTSSATWLSGSVGAATTCPNGPVSVCIPITINLATAGLSIGSYTESLTVTDPNAIDSPQTITVTVQVNGAPGTVDLYVTPNNGASTAQSSTAAVFVNTGASVQSTTKTQDNGQWLTFSISGGGSYTFFTPYVLRATSQVGQGEGNYTGSVVLSGSINAADNKVVTVNLHVTSQPILQIPAAPITLNLTQGQAAQNTTISFTNLGFGNLAISSATANTSSGGNWLSTSGASGSSLVLTANPSGLAPGSYLGSVTLSSNAANTATPIPVRLNVAAQSGPLIAIGGIVDNASFSSGQPVASGSIAAIFGTQFASGPFYASSLPLPTSLGGIQVLVNGTAAPIFYVDANQVDIQAPFEITGQSVVQMVRNGQGGNQVSVILDPIAPRLFALRQLPPAPDTSPYGIVINAADGTLALPSNLGVPAHPAKRGDVVTIYALGLGPVSPSIPTGVGAPSSEPLARVTNSVQVLFGGGFLGFSTATPSYAGLAPTFAGLYQINVTIPLDTPTGNVPVMINMPGHASNFVEMAIAPNP